MADARDNAYYSGLDSEYQVGLFDIYTNMLGKSVLWPAVGNHDTAQATDFVDTYPYFDIFIVAEEWRSGRGRQRHGALLLVQLYANLHFICSSTR